LGFLGANEIDSLLPTGYLGTGWLTAEKSISGFEKVHSYAHII
jgi:hypothetical protein